MNKGILFVFSGPSGVGKGTILQGFLQDNPDCFYSVSATTRSKRPGEIDGVNYYYITREEFEEKISNNGMLEYAEYNGNYYGTPKSTVDEMLNIGKNVFLEIEVQGAMKVKKLCPNAVFIFVMPPDINALHDRLCGRNTEDEETIKNRISAANYEINNASEYDYIIINDTVESAQADLSAIVRAAKCSYIYKKEFVDEVLKKC